VIPVATLQEYLEAAKVLPANRTTAQQALVDAGKNIQAVRNADEAAKRHQKIHGANG